MPLIGKPRNAGRYSWSGIHSLNTVQERRLYGDWRQSRSPESWPYTLENPRLVGGEASTSTYRDETTLQAFEFFDDGNKFIMFGSSGDKLLVYSVGSPYSFADRRQIFNDTFANIPATSSFATATGAWISNNAQYMVITGQSVDLTETYELTTPGDFTTLTKISSVATSTLYGSGNSFGIFAKPDGTKIYVGDISTGLSELTLSTAWDLSTATNTHNIPPSAIDDINGSTVFLSPDGLNLYTAHSSDENLFQYTLTTAWDLSTASKTRVLNFTNQAGTWGVFSNIQTVDFNPDGTKIFIGGSNDVIRRGTLSSPWNISTATPDHDACYFERIPQSLVWFPDGTGCWELRADDSTWYEWKGSAYDPSSWAKTGKTQANLTGGPASSTTIYPGCVFGDNGNVFMFHIDSNTYLYTLSTPYDLTTATLHSNNNQLQAGAAIILSGIGFNEDGTKIWYYESGGDDLHTVSLGSAYDLTSMTADAPLIDISIYSSSPALYVDPTLEHLFGFEGPDGLNYHQATTPGDVSTFPQAPSQTYYEGLIGQMRFLQLFDSGKKLMFVECLTTITSNTVGTNTDQFAKVCRMDL